MLDPKNSSSVFNRSKHLSVGVIGLGYVGLPLAVEFAKKRTVIGFDIDCQRIDQLKTQSIKRMRLIIMIYWKLIQRDQFLSHQIKKICQILIVL